MLVGIGHYFANTWKDWFLEVFMPLLIAIKVDDPSLSVLVNFYLP